MREFNVVVKDASGIHARPAGLLVKEINKYNSSVKIELKNKVADGKRIFSVMGLGAKCGDELKIIIEGNDENEAAENLKTFFDNNL